MNKAYLVWQLTAILLSATLPAQAQQPGKVYRIGLLDRGNARTSAVRLEPFWQELRRLGWVEGKNFTVESRFADNAPESRTVEQAAELVRLKVDAIVCASTSACLIAKKATSAIAIVIAGSADPVGAGLIASLARPGGNVTGVSSMDVELNTKRLEVLKDAMPKLTRAGIPLVNTSGGPLGAVSEARSRKVLKAAAAALKLDLVEFPLTLDVNKIEDGIQSAKQQQLGAIIIIGRPLFTLRKRVVELAAKYRLPAIYPYRRAATYVDKIIKGVTPAELPVEQPMKFEFIVNLKTAKQIGLTIPPNVLVRADRVIK